MGNSEQPIRGVGAASCGRGSRSPFVRIVPVIIGPHLRVKFSVEVGRNRHFARFYRQAKFNDMKMVIFSKVLFLLNSVRDQATTGGSRYKNIILCLDFKVLDLLMLSFHILKNS